MINSTKDAFNKVFEELSSLKTAIRTFETSNYFSSVQRGFVPGQIIKHIYGHNDDVGTTFEDIWITGGVRTWLQAAVSLEAISTSADDTLAGTGARIITIEGLDSDFNFITSDINMNGLTVTSVTTEEYIRVNSAFVKTCGTYTGANAGTITIRASGAGATQVLIPIDNTKAVGQSFNSHHTIPANKDAWLLQYEVITDSSKTATVLFSVREDADIITAPFSPARVKALEQGVSGPNGHSPYSLFGPIPAKSDIWFSGKVDAGSTSVSVAYELLIIDR